MPDGYLWDAHQALAQVAQHGAVGLVPAHGGDRLLRQAPGLLEEADGEVNGVELLVLLVLRQLGGAVHQLRHLLRDLVGVKHICWLVCWCAAVLLVCCAGAARFAARFVFWLARSVQECAYQVVLQRTLARGAPAYIPRARGCQELPEDSRKGFCSSQPANV
jgi:hypothetical protein